MEIDYEKWKGYRQMLFPQNVIYTHQISHKAQPSYYTECQFPERKRGSEGTSMYETPGRILGHREKQGMTDTGHLSVPGQSDTRE